MTVDTLLSSHKPFLPWRASLLVGAESSAAGALAPASSPRPANERMRAHELQGQPRLE